MNIEITFGRIIAIIALVGVALFSVGGFGANESNQVTIIRSPIATSDNDQRIITESTWYWTFPVFSKVIHYPKYFQAEYTRDIRETSPTDESIRVTFNDAAWADLDTMVAIALPLDHQKLMQFNQRFGGNMDAVELAIWSHLSNCIKSSGPIMSSSENQSARKGEFTQIVQEQLEKGLFETRKKEMESHDQFDQNGKPITVFTTEVVADPKTGKPIILRTSPLAELGLIVAQFSVTHTEYDKATQESFGIKKQSFLAIENAKTNREKEMQSRLQVEQQGLREKAEVEAVANKDKAKATIAAQKEKEVAELQAQQRAEVAKLEKEAAETQAKQALEVAKLQREAAEENAKKILILANAEEQKIAKAGALTEVQRAEIDARVLIADKVSENLSKIQSPQVVIGGGQGGGENNFSNLLNLFLLRQSGVIDNLSKK